MQHIKWTSIAIKFQRHIRIKLVFEMPYFYWSMLAMRSNEHIQARDIQTVYVVLKDTVAGHENWWRMITVGIVIDCIPRLDMIQKRCKTLINHCKGITIKVLSRKDKNGRLFGKVSSLLWKHLSIYRKRLVHFKLFVLSLLPSTK